MKIAIIGAGAWGTALAICASGQHSVTLWARDVMQVEAMQASGQNNRYLPGIALPNALALRPIDGLGNATGEQLSVRLGDCDLLVLATPIAGLREWLGKVQSATCPVIWLCKGFEQPISDSFGLLAHEVQAQVAPHLVAGTLSGPSFASEVARGLPTALVAASRHSRVSQQLVEAFHGGNLRVYATDDVVGAEVGGAVKNVLAIAAGLCDGLGLGLNARAALITRGLAEMARLGAALGARAETFMGLSGLGDLVLTATGDLSRNRSVGLQLAQGLPLSAILGNIGHVAEGVHCARTVVQRAQLLNVEMPIAAAVVALLEGDIAPQQAVQRLMQRQARQEIT
jgi:glycerol-3-phosphate dehydrogenase (NAD(P)+)